MPSEQAEPLPNSHLRALKIQLQNIDACIAALEEFERLQNSNTSRRNWHGHSIDRHYSGHQGRPVAAATPGKPRRSRSD